MTVQAVPPPEAADREIEVPCLCPDQGHGDAGDTVTLRETLDFVAVRAIRYAAQIEQAEDEEASVATLMAAMSEGYILEGIESWTLREGRKAMEVNKANIRKHVLRNMAAAQRVSDYADALYRPQVILPLAELARHLSQRSQMNESTSVPSASPSTSPSEPETVPNGSNGKSSTRSGTRQKPSRRSSTTSTPTDSTGPTSDVSVGAYTS